MPRGIRIQVSDEDLRRAVRRADSWRGVLRELGYATTNGRTSMELRQRAQALRCDSTHFRHRPTKWTDKQLRRAIQDGNSWGDVLRILGLSTGGTASVSVRTRAIQLGIDYSHIERREKIPRGEMPFTAEPRLDLLRTAAPSLAAGWFLRRGYHVSWPLEPCPYDLLADAGRIPYRIQVKTATGRDAKTGAWACGLVQNGNRKGSPYDPADIDFFFIIDADGGYYIIPIEEVAGQGSVNLNTMEHRRVSNGL